MARTGGPKTRCGGLWTEAKYKSFIKGNLRSATRKWAPISKCLTNARTRRGFYLCNGCKQEVPNTIKDENGKRVKNALVDHINPIIDPAVGWVSWDETIERMFTEIENLQVLCHACHQEKSNAEKAVAKQRRLENTIEDEEED
jgi:5-methylcytosine-specific restriction endonuclease McrA